VPAPEADDPAGNERPSVGFWLIVGLAGLYLLLRVVQGLVWAAQQVF